jgi:hypothetical protein
MIAIAAHAGNDGGGGDLKCDAKIKSISANINSWIKGGGPEVGKLDLSSSTFPNSSQPYTLAEYDKAMLALLKLPLDSSCVTKGDPGYPVQVADDSKVCASSVSNGQVHMKCDQVKLLGMDPDLQIEQIHHEYAINVPGLEPDYGPISTYKISMQLAMFTRDTVERRLIVGPSNSGVTTTSDYLFTLPIGAQIVLGQSVGLPANSSSIALIDFEYPDTTGPNVRRGLWCELKYQIETYQRILDPRTLTLTDIKVAGNVGADLEDGEVVISLHGQPDFELDCYGLGPQTNGGSQLQIWYRSYISDLKMALQALGGDLILPPPVHE